MHFPFHSILGNSQVSFHTVPSNPWGCRCHSHTGSLFVREGDAIPKIRIGGPQAVQQELAANHEILG
jgi:hypothetical protein